LIVWRLLIKNLRASPHAFLIAAVHRYGCIIKALLELVLLLKLIQTLQKVKTGWWSILAIKSDRLFPAFFNTSARARQDPIVSPSGWI
jgi:hypothetical protein